MLRKDGEGRYPMSQREYMALWHVLGINNAFLVSENILEERLRLIPGALDDYKLIEDKANDLLKKLADTLPTNKLRALKAEIPLIKVEVYTKGPVGRVSSDKEMTVVPLSALDYVCHAAQMANCEFCEYEQDEHGHKAKSGKKTKSYKRCALYRNLTEMYHFDLEMASADADGKADDGRCPFAHNSLDLEMSDDIDAADG